MLTLRPPTVQDEPALRRMHEQLAAESFDFLLAEGPWAQILAQVQAESEGRDLLPGRVRADFLVAAAEGIPVGRVSIRHELSPFLREVGGHVGYAVAPEFRRRGHATQILRLSVERLRGLGVEQVLVTCDDDNLASAATIERCGGVLEDVRARPGGGMPKRRYWIGGAPGR
ncbi:Acetyltransferase [Serinicoccus hydrothermalis]|uniref:Acetyltransferase n=1 Tax=Serinicoccus hydrothermalis TaxID=1758689 RepID=A0A1B1NFI2_9MICO|nr:GNAT family N-acetyltransferase [Serinicoccus hydrothermalis]ANS80173.1 Acetyltransferase [Serinicoccus hydrothermalis]